MESRFSGISATFPKTGGTAVHTADPGAASMRMRTPTRVHVTFRWPREERVPWARRDADAQDPSEGGATGMGPASGLGGRQTAETLDERLR